MVDTQHITSHSMGLKLLKRYGSSQALKNMRKDATASDSFVKHNIATGDVAADFTRMLHDANWLLLLTKNELLREDSNNDDGSEEYEPASASFSQTLPDIFIDYMNSGDDWEEYLLEVWHDTIPFWVYRKRIKYYMEYVDEDEREEAFSSGIPPLLLVCDTPTLQRRVQRYLKRMVDDIDEDDLKVLVTNRELLHEANEDEAIWTIVGENGNTVIRFDNYYDMFIMETRPENSYISYDAYELAYATNNAFDRRREAAVKLATVLKIISDAELGYYDERKASMGPVRFDEYWQTRQGTVEDELAVTTQDFAHMQQAASDLMPPWLGKEAA